MLIVHPEYAELILDVNNLIDEIANLIVERDILNFFVCKDLEIDYTLKIGSLKYKLIVAQNLFEKNNRKLEIIQEKIDKNKEININSIDKKINSEFKEQTRNEKEMLECIDFAIDMSSLELFDYDLIDEMSIDYYKLQKMYNPIFDNNIDTEKVNNYKKIEKYFQKQNFKKLKKLAENYDSDYIVQDEIDNLKILKEKYEEIILNLQKEIRRIKNTFPYNQKIILEEENLYRRKKDNINKEIIEMNLKNQKLQRKIDKLIDKN